MNDLEHFDADHIHTTPEGRHLRHGDGTEVDGEGNPLVQTNLEVIWTATWDWLTIAERQGLDIDWSAEPIQYDSKGWLAACELAEVDAEDMEVGFGELIAPRDCDTLLRPGDIVCTQGYGGNIAFLRRKVD